MLEVSCNSIKKIWNIMNSWFHLTGSEKGGLIQKMDDLKESIKQAGETLEKGQQNLETIDGMYSKNFKLLKWNMINQKNI